jgi:predicted XRE-type DNA-binding protein
MVGDFHTKPLQGSAFRHFRAIILNLPHDPLLDSMTDSQECVGTKPSVHTSISMYELEVFSKPLNQDTEGWITVKNSSRKNSRKKAVTFLKRQVTNSNFINKRFHAVLTASSSFISLIVNKSTEIFSMDALAEGHARNSRCQECGWLIEPLAEPCTSSHFVTTLLFNLGSLDLRLED